MTIPLTYTRDDLIAAVTALRPAAEKADAKALAKHQKAEAAHLAAFRKGCREALKWDYETAKDHYFMALPARTRNAPSCPLSQVSLIDRHLAELAKTTQTRFTLSSNGVHSGLYGLLTADLPSIKGLC